MRVWDSKNDRFAHPGAGTEDMLDFDRIELSPGDVDEVAHTSCDDQALRSATEKIAGNEASVAEDSGIGFGEVSEANGVTVDFDASGGLVVDQPHTTHGFADAARRGFV